MFDDFKEWLFNFIKSRSFVLTAIFICCFGALLYRVFYLQIVKGAQYQETFALKLEREVTTASTRGKIFDRNGEVLAYSELSYSVAIEDNGTYETTKEKQHSLNDTIYRLIQLIEKNGDESIYDFGIIYEDGRYQFVNEGTRLLRFKADVFGHATIDKLETEQELATPDEIMDYMCGTERYRIDEGGYSDEYRLKILNVRYAMSSNSYKRYVKTRVSSNVSEKTVAAVMENITDLQGVSIEEDSIRVYPDAKYFAPLIGWIGKASDEEIETFNEEIGKEKYQLNDIVGKSGIEQYMEIELQGTKGSQIIDVDSVGHILNVESIIEPIPGNDIYLSVDKNLQIACYDILEQKLAGILLEKITNTKTYTSTGRAKDIKIPIYDVYYACFDNNIIDIDQFTQEDASELERSVHQRFEQKLSSVLYELREELNNPNAKAYKDLSLEMKNYMSHIVSSSCLMGENDVLNPDSADSMYKAWHTDESISLKTYLEYAISMNWINVSKVAKDTPYLDSEEIYNALIDYITQSLSEDSKFGEMIYRFMLQDDLISGRETALLLYDQGVLNSADDEEYTRLLSGTMSAYDFFITKITNLEITPGMLALEPCSGGMVVTDPNNGDVLACVSYPGFDNNRLTNTMEADYYSQLLNDNARPMYSRATQEKTAPGSTFKPLSAIAGLCEGVISTSPSNTITCTGVYTKVSNHPKCWILTQNGGSHGTENVVDAIKDSCNCYFYEVGFRLGSTGNGLSNEVGLEKLAEYATMFGLGNKSGLETEESEPQISDQTIVPSAIGQGSHNYTVSQIARYVTTIANGGTCYNLSLLNKVTDSGGKLVEEYGSTVYNILDVPLEYMSTVQQGMNAYAMNSSVINKVGINTAGKTGTAEQSVNHPNHALFIGYAPYESPEIALAVRIAHGYTSANAASIAADVYKYYFDLVEKDELLSGQASAAEGTVVGD